MSAALVPCTYCGHRRGLHKSGSACGDPGCSCPSFTGSTPVEAEDQPDQAIGRLVQVVVPDGFSVSITLTPIREEPSDG